MVIGRQIETDFGGIIDLLCLDKNGDTVIIELKRDKTPRDITAQVLDYASWIKDLSHSTINEIYEKYTNGKKILEEEFKGKFGEELPDTLNSEHKMMIVASEIDSSSERIINYLSDSYGIDINAATFQYFKDENNNEFLSRVFLIEPSEVEYKTKTKTSSKRKPYLTYEQLEQISENNGVKEVYLAVDSHRQRGEKPIRHGHHAAATEKNAFHEPFSPITIRFASAHTHPAEETG